MDQFAGQLRVQAHGQLAVVVGNGRTGSPTAGMAEQGQVRPCLQPQVGLGQGQFAKFDKVISAAAAPELGPGLVLPAAGHNGDGPVFIQDLVLVPLTERSADPEPGFPFDGRSQAFGLFLQG